MDEKVLEEIEGQADRSRDTGSPLYLIREKEIEISGRVLAAKKQAENLVSEARRKAAETVSKAEIEAEELAANHEKEMMAKAQDEAARLRAGVGDELSAIEETIAARRSKAVDAVVKLVTEA